MRIRQSKDRFNIGHNIRKYRMQTGLTQEQTVARMQLMGVEISRGTYSQIECGIANIRVEDLLALRSIFHINMDDFFVDIVLPNDQKTDENSVT